MMMRILIKWKLELFPFLQLENVLSNVGKFVNPFGKSTTRSAGRLQLHVCLEWEWEQIMNWGKCLQFSKLKYCTHLSDHLPRYSL